jgi:methionyl-tRNA formyltransferase
MTDQPAQLSVLYFGMTGRFSPPPLRALLRAGIAVRAVILPALPGSPPIAPIAPPARPSSHRALPIAGAPAEPNILEIARGQRIPTYEVGSLAAREALDLLRDLAPDALCVACFTRRLPPALLDLPRLGSLNVHPSLLPDNRGPDPLVWTFRRGDRETGITIHLMDADLDSGPILAQRTIPVPEGISEATLERACAEAGGQLLASALRGLADGTLIPRPQDPALATTYPLPGPDDYTISGDLAARVAYTFAAGLVGREQPLQIVAAGAAYHLLTPLAYDADATLNAPYHLHGDTLTLRCSPGTFTARVSHGP